MDGMQIHSRYKLDRAVARAEDPRSNTRGFLIDTEVGLAVVTDGRILATVPCEIEDDDMPVGEVVIPAEALKAARKAKVRGAEELGIEIGAGRVFVSDENGQQSFRALGGEYPNYKNVLPEKGDGFSITLNADMLHRLADALGAEGSGVTLTFQKDKTGQLDSRRPVHVTPLGDHGDAKPVGVIVPLSGI